MSAPTDEQRVNLAVIPALTLVRDGTEAMLSMWQVIAAYGGDPTVEQWDELVTDCDRLKDAVNKIQVYAETRSLLTGGVPPEALQ